MNPYLVLSQAPRQRVSDGHITTVVPGNPNLEKLLVIVAPQLGDFDSLEYVGWLQREQEKLRSRQIEVRIVGIGDRAAGQQFCDFTGFPSHLLWVDPVAQLHRDLELYAGLQVRVPGFGTAANAWTNLMLMCAGIGSPGTLQEVFRGYIGDKQAPQLIAPDETVKAGPLPPLQGSVFNAAGGTGFQRPFELATLRLRNMTEVLQHWSTYVPDPAYLTQRGATFVFDAQGNLLYEYRDRGILGFAENMSEPLAFLWDL